jgi:CelD/BcsL family acetyltransferase involved in cellulose biosynthesis
MTASASSNAAQEANAPARAQDPALALRVVSTDAELEALRPAWEALHAATAASVFQSWDWQVTWWRRVGGRGGRNTLHVVVLSEGGEVVCIAPLFVEAARAAGLVTLRRLEFVGTGLTDHQDLIVARGHEGAACERLAAHLEAIRTSFDVISLSDVPDHSRTGRLLHEALARRGFEGPRFVNEQCPRTRLADTWTATLATFDGNHRRQLSKRVRQLGEKFQVALELCGRREDLARDVEAFIDLHQRRWTGVGMKGVYAEPHVAEFQREVSRRFFERGWLFLAFLRLDGARVAAICGFEHRGELAYYLNGVGDLGEAARYSPGLVLHALCMEEMIRRGVRVYDFLRGTERYKYECGAVDVPNWTTLMFRRGARWARVKSKVVLLAESLARRAEQEGLAFAHQRRTHGLWSRALAGWLGARIGKTVRDGWQKLRAPERSLTNAADRQPRGKGAGGGAGGGGAGR